LLPRRFSIFLVAVAFVYLAGLSQVGIFGPDEPRYSAIGVEMAHSGDWLTPRLWGHPWFEKSPLLYWMTAAATLLGLGPETAPRLPVALTALTLIVFIYKFLKPRLGLEVATHSAILLAGAAAWVAFGSVGVTDVPLTTHFTICLLLIVFGGPAWLAGIFLGLAVLAKGLVPFVLFLPLLWWLYREKRLRELIPIGITCLLVAGPWYAAITLKHGHAFFDEFILKHHFARFSNDSLQHVRAFWFFFPVLAGLLLPWTGLLPFVTKGFKDDPRLRFLATWVLFGFVFFSAGKNKLPGYVLPLVPIVCILIAAALEDVSWTTRVSPILAITSGLLVTFGLQILPALPRLLNEGWTRTPLTAQPWHWLAGLCVAVAVWWIARSGRKTVTLCAVSGVVLSGLVWVKFSPIASDIDRNASARSLSKTAAKDGCVHPNDRDLRYGLSYYWGFEVPECNDDTLPKRILRKFP
jgi:4-amino-4-deoxy-L-arabinose transferase-like glycosyltransferase